jgi:WD40 repeat protein
VAYSPDGKQVAAALGGENAIHVWDTATGMELRRLTRQQFAVINSIAYVNAKHLLSCGDDHAVQLWDTQTKELLHLFGGAQESVVAVAVSRDGRRAASVARDGRVYFWDLVKRMPRQPSNGPLNEPLAIALSADGSLAAVGYGGGIQLFKDGKATDKLTGHGSYVRAIAFTPDGRHLLSCGGDKTMRLWELDSRKEIARFVGERAPVMAVACTPDGRFAVTGSADGTLRVWRLPQQLAVAAAPPKSRPPQVAVNPAPRPGPELLPPDRTPLPPDPQPTASPLPLGSQETTPQTAAKAYGPFHTWDTKQTICTLAVLPDGRRALVGSNELTLIDLERGLPVGRLGMPLKAGSLTGCVAISPDGKRAATAMWREDVVRLWNLATGLEYGRLTGHDGPVNCVTFVDNKRVLTGGDDKTVRLWDWDAKKKKPKQVHVFEGHPDRVQCVAVSRDGSQAASGGLNGGLRLWDLNKLQQAGAVPNLPIVQSVAFSPDGVQVAVGHLDGVTLLKGRRQAGKLSTPKGVVANVAFTPDGRRLVSCGPESTVRLWDLDTRREVARFEGHAKAVRLLGVGPSGKWFLTGGADRMLMVWKLPKLAPPKTESPRKKVAEGDPPSGRPVPRLLTGHTTPVTSVAFSPSGKRLLSGDAKTLRYWDVGKGTLLLAMPAPNPIKCVGFAPDGQRALSGGADGRVLLWDLKNGTNLSSSIRPPFIHSVLAVAFLHRQNTVVLIDGRGGLHNWYVERRSMNHPTARKDLRAAAVAPRAQLAAIVTVGDGVELWEVGARPMKWGALPGSTQALSVALSEDGTKVVTGGSDGLVRLWDRVTQREIRPFEGHEGKVNAVAISPDGRRALSGGEDKIVRLWDLETGKELQHFPGHTGSVLSVAFSPDGNLAASGSADNTVRLWPLTASGKE